MGPGYNALCLGLRSADASILYIKIFYTFASQTCQLHFRYFSLHFILLQAKLVSYISDTFPFAVKNGSSVCDVRQKNHGDPWNQEKCMFKEYNLFCYHNQGLHTKLLPYTPKFGKIIRIIFSRINGTSPLFPLIQNC